MKHLKLYETDYSRDVVFVSENFKYVTYDKELGVYNIDTEQQYNAPIAVIDPKRKTFRSKSEYKIYTAEELLELYEMTKDSDMKIQANKFNL